MVLFRERGNEDFPLDKKDCEGSNGAKKGLTVCPAESNDHGLKGFETYSVVAFWVTKSEKLSLQMSERVKSRPK